MFIAQELRKSNIAEYLLYMWQVEDTLRAYGLDVDRMEREYIPQFGLDAEKSETLKGWYENLIEMMREEGVTEKGHLQVNRNILILLTDLHAQLLKSSKHPFYSAAYYKALPFIVELRKRGSDTDATEVETCLNALYGVMLLRLQQREISPDTEHAVKEISTLMGMLSDYYLKDKSEGLEFD